MTENEQQELRDIVNRANYVADSQGVYRVDPLPQDLHRYLVLANQLYASLPVRRLGEPS